MKPGIKSLRSGWERAFALFDREAIYDWAERHIDLSYPFIPTGPFSSAHTRHLLAPFDAIADPRIREVNVCAPTRGGKSLLGDISLPWIVQHDPGPMLWVFSIDRLAREHAEERAFPILRSVENVRHLLPARNKDRTTEILFGFMSVFFRGQAMDNLQSKAMRWIILDEVWRYKSGVLAEAKARLDDYLKLELSKFLCLSQAGTDGDEWHEQYRAGELNEWSIQCAKCDTHQVPVWAGWRDDGSRYGVLWDLHRRDTGDWDVPRCLSSVRYECARCGHPHLDNEKTRAEWNRTGKYQVVGERHPTKKSFHWPAIIDRSLAELVSRYLAARNLNRRGMPAATIKFWQKYMASFYSPSVGQIRRPLTEGYEVSKDGATEGWRRFMTVDCQVDFREFWVVIRDWAQADGQSQRVFRGRLKSWEEVRELQEKFKVKDQNVFVDTNYETRAVYARCVRFGHWGVIGSRRMWLCWIGLRGEDEFDYLHLERRNKKSVKVRRLYSPMQFGDPHIGRSRRDVRLVGPTPGGGTLCPYFRFSNEQAKDALARHRDGHRIRQGSAAPPRWVNPIPQTAEEKREEEEYDRQLNSEFKRTIIDRRTGKEKMRWLPVAAGRPNHYWDCEVMQMVAAAIAGYLGEEAAAGEIED